MRVQLHLYENSPGSKGIICGNFLRYNDDSDYPISRGEFGINQFVITTKISFETFSDHVGSPHLTFIAEKAIRGKSTGEQLYAAGKDLWLSGKSEVYASAYIYSSLRDFLTDLLSRTGRVNAFTETLTPDYSNMDYNCTYFFIFNFCETIAKRVVREYRKKLREFEKSHPEISEEESV